MRLALMMVLAATLGVAVWAGDLRVDTATYLGGKSAAEEWNAVDIAPGGVVVAAGTMPEGAFGAAKAIDLMGGGYGTVLRYEAGMGTPLTMTRLGDYIDDMEVGEDGTIAVCGSFGVALLAADGGSVLWRDGAIVHGSKAAAFRNQTPPFKNDRYTKRVSRVAIGTDGTVASLQNDEKAHSGDMKGHLYVWDKSGKRLADVALTTYKYPEDLCVDSANGQVIVGGFNTYAHDSVHMKNHPIHMQWITAYSYTGETKWKDYDFPAKDVYDMNTYADCRVQRLNIGADGMLYMGGYIHGGDYVWKHDPHDVKRRVNVDTGYDSFSTAANMGRGIDQSYFAQFDPKTGDILKGQVLLTRVQANGGGKPAQIQIKGIEADAAGNVYIAGYCEAYIKDRGAQRVNGELVGDYYKPEPFVLAISPDWKTRKVWTVFAKHCEAAAWGLGLRDGYVAIAGEVYEGEVITTENAVQKAPLGAIDGFLAVWQTDPEVEMATLMLEDALGAGKALKVTVYGRGGVPSAVSVGEGKVGACTALTLDGNKLRGGMTTGLGWTDGEEVRASIDLDVTFEGAVATGKYRAMLGDGNTNGAVSGTRRAE